MVFVPVSLLLPRLLSSLVPGIPDLAAEVFIFNIYLGVETLAERGYGYECRCGILMARFELVFFWGGRVLRKMR